MATKRKTTKRKAKPRGESPCKVCKPIKHSPARRADGTFKKKPRKSQDTRVNH